MKKKRSHSPKEHIKKIRRIKKQTSVNKARKSRYKIALKKMNGLIENKDKKKALAYLPKLNSELMKIAKTGVIKKDIAEKYGLNINCKVFGGAGDNAAAAVGLGLYEEGDASISLGTSGVIFGSTKKFLKNYDDAIHSFCHCLPNTWHLMSVMLSCTSNINWFINAFNSSIKEITDLICQNREVSKKLVYNYCLKLKNEN